MTEPRRWKEDAALGAIFRSADHDVPEPEARSALLGSLGLGTAALAPAAAATAAGAAGKAAGAATLTKAVGIATIAKYVVATVVVASAATAIGVGVTREASPESPGISTSAPSTIARPTIQKPPAPIPSPAETAPEEPASPTLDVNALASAHVAPSAAPSITVKPIAPAAPSLDDPQREAKPAEAKPAEAKPLEVKPAFAQPAFAKQGRVAEEIASLDRARALLAGGRPNEALVVLEVHKRAFRDGSLAQEAAVLEIEALANAGQRDRARVLGERFLADQPNSPLASRVRHVVP